MGIFNRITNAITKFKYKRDEISIIFRPRLRRDELKFDEKARASTGLSINWYSVIGPLKLVFAKPLNANNFDKTEMIQFSLGTMF